eukprot:CAMPEP_0115724226 /NCGR_PEP_ID=MMETSP0272-20121206/80665_1 /TAXON_ID=71861 /ORGANISM="Scrippsiella trochoidea, Strain CCMP3099" /LENGTH=171 /DNA_ID=CAMNT_0003167435 /DNA_START=105 /DNA_END=622 /DNA_ORIENTATION=-
MVPSPSPAARRSPVTKGGFSSCGPPDVQAEPSSPVSAAAALGGPCLCAAKGPLRHPGRLTRDPKSDRGEQRQAADAFMPTLASKRPLSLPGVEVYQMHGSRVLRHRRAVARGIDNDLVDLLLRESLKSSGWLLQQHPLGAQVEAQEVGTRGRQEEVLVGGGKADGGDVAGA